MKKISTIVCVAAVVNALTVIACVAADRGQRMFGHDVAVTAGKNGENRLMVDGNVMLKDYYLSLGEVAVVGGVPAMLGESGSGGNACEPARFVVSFPVGAKPRLDGPLDTCGGTKYMIERDRIRIEASAMPGREGRSWTWTPDVGFSAPKTVAFAPSGKSGWDALRSRSVDHPLGLLKYADLAGVIRNAIPDRMRGSLERILSGPGNLAYHGGLVVGSACQAHSCDDTAVVVAIDTVARKAYVAVKDTGRPASIEPPLRQWPSVASEEIADFRRRFLR